MATFIPLHAIPLQIQDPITSENMSGGSLEFYDAGTTTPQELYSDNAGTSIGTSIALNSAGWPESGGNTINLFRDQSEALKIVCKDAAGATLFTSDNIPAVASFDATSSAKLATIEENADVTDATNVAAAGALMADGSNPTTADFTLGSTTFIAWSTANSLVASTTQTQGQQPLTNSLNEVATVANTNDTITLPAASLGREVMVINNGANTLQIFPASGDFINDLAVDTAETISSGDNVRFVCYNTTTWEAI